MDQEPVPLQPPLAGLSYTRLWCQPATCNSPVWCPCFCCHAAGSITTQIWLLPLGALRAARDRVVRVASGSHLPCGIGHVTIGLPRHMDSVSHGPQQVFAAGDAVPQQWFHGVNRGSWAKDVKVYRHDSPSHSQMASVLVLELHHLVLIVWALLFSM
jgi:hypothetical protein